MQVTAANPLEFKFQWLNEEGRPTGWLRKKGRFDGETLTLDDAQIPSAVIVEVATRDACLAITALSGNGEPAALVLMASSEKVAEQLKMSLDVARSSVWADMHRKDLEEKGHGHTFRTEQCPQCQATVDLSAMPRTPQLYCPFCQSLSTVGPAAEPVSGEKHLRLCDECGMFSKPQRFTIFYFYFVLLFYGWWSKVTWRCPACMRGEAWKMLFGNLLFVLGVPVALVQLFRSYGGTDISGPFRGLDKGNIKARNGDSSGALAHYRAILDRVPQCAGLKYNLGLALLQEGDKGRAAEAFAVALDDCANYLPAYQRLRPLYEELGETDRLMELKAMWDTPDEEEAAHAPVEEHDSDERDSLVAAGGATAG